MDTFVKYYDEIGVVLFSVLLVYQIYISYKVKRADFLKKISDPADVKMYEQLTSKKYTIFFSAVLLIYVPGLFRDPKPEENRVSAAIIILMIILAVAIIIQSYYKFHKR